MIAMKENSLINMVSITVDAILSQPGVSWVNFTANFSYIDDNGITQHNIQVYLFHHRNIPIKPLILNFLSL